MLLSGGWSLQKAKNEGGCRTPPCWHPPCPHTYQPHDSHRGPAPRSTFSRLRLGRKPPPCSSSPSGVSFLGTEERDVGAGGRRLLKVKSTGQGHVGWSSQGFLGPAQSPQCSALGAAPGEGEPWKPRAGRGRQGSAQPPPAPSLVSYSLGWGAAGARDPEVTLMGPLHRWWLGHKPHGSLPRADARGKPSITLGWKE